LKRVHVDLKLRRRKKYVIVDRQRAFFSIAVFAFVFVFFGDLLSKRFMHSAFRMCLF